MAGLTKVKGSGLATGAATASLVGIDDNATSTAITIDASENVALVGDALLGSLTGFSGGTGALTIADSASNPTISIRGPDAGTANIYFGDTTDWTQGAISYDFSTDAMRFYTSNINERMRIDSSGNVNVKTGNLVIGTSGKGIDFSAATPDGTGTTGSEVLDDYEEGNYTATLTMGSGTASLSIADVAYTKVGRLVTISGQVRIGSVSSPSGSMQISLPFTCLSGNKGLTVGNYRSYLIDTPNDGVQAVLSTESGQALANFEWSRDNANSTNENATSGGYLMVGLTYMTA